MIYKQNQQNDFEWQDVTADVKTIKKISNDNNKRYYEITYKNGKPYIYSIDKIRWLNDPKPIQLTKFKPIHKGITLFNIVDGLFFEDWCRFFFANGIASAYSRDYIEWIELTNDEPKFKDYLDYLK